MTPVCFGTPPVSCRIIAQALGVVDILIAREPSAVSRFSGRAAPLHPGGTSGLPAAVTREAYSHEVSRAGFWPGDEAFPQAAFYSYAYPEPAGFGEGPQMAHLRPINFILRRLLFSDQQT